MVDDVGGFSDVVHATRNYYTHHNPKWLNKGLVAKRADLFRLNEKLKILFQMWILHEMGVSHDRFGVLRGQLASHVSYPD